MLAGLPVARKIRVGGGARSWQSVARMTLSSGRQAPSHARRGVGLSLKTLSHAASMASAAVSARKIRGPSVTANPRRGQQQRALLRREIPPRDQPAGPARQSRPAPEPAATAARLVGEQQHPPVLARRQPGADRPRCGELGHAQTLALLRRLDHDRAQSLRVLELHDGALGQRGTAPADPELDRFLDQPVEPAAANSGRSGGRARARGAGGRSCSASSSVASRLPRPPAPPATRRLPH